MLDAQRRRAQAESAYFRSLVDYNRSIAQFHFRKGSLLEYNGVFLSEGPWPGKAYFDAHRRARQRDASLYLDYGHSRPGVFSRGPITQQFDAVGAAANAQQMPPRDPATRELPATLPRDFNAEELPTPIPNDTPSFPAAAYGFPGEEINLSSSFQQTKKSAIDSVSNAEDTKGLQRRDADIVTTGWQEPVTPAAAAVENPDSAAETQLQ